MPPMRKILVGILIILGVLFVINYFSQLGSIVNVAKQGDWRFISLAIFVEFLWLFAAAATYWAVYRALGINKSLLRLVPIAAASNFVNIVAPSGGASSLAVLISDAKRNKIPRAHATVAQVLFILVEYIGFTFFLVVGLVALFRNVGLNPPELIASALLWLSALALAAVLYLGSQSEKLLARTLLRFIRFINKIIFPFRKRILLKEQHADTIAKQIADGLMQVKEKPGKLLLAVLIAALSKALLLLVFMLMFLAFKVPLVASTLFAAFALAYLFVIVSPTPSGIGVVEGLVTLSLISLRVPVGAAALIVLGYRAITFWLPLFLGMLAVQRLSIRSGKQPSS